MPSLLLDRQLDIVRHPLDRSLGSDEPVDKPTLDHFVTVCVEIETFAGSEVGCTDSVDDGCSGSKTCRVSCPYFSAR